MEQMDNRYIILPAGDIEEIKEKLTLILNNISNGNGKENSIHSDFLDQKAAEKYLGKKCTWFWQMRKSNRLFPKKLGNKNYYRKSELDKLLEDS
jgi:predicted DNA-binding transcriptional regulator AlpA